MLVLAALNPRPSLSVRLLTSRSPALPLGVWLAAGGAGGALLSGLGTALALRGAKRRLSQTGAGPTGQEPWFSGEAAMGRDAAAPTASGGQRRPVMEREPWPESGPERAPGEPPPTVSVPFRVLRRPAASSTPAPSGSAEAPRPSSARRTAVETAAQAQDADDWNTHADEDW